MKRWKSWEKETLTVEYMAANGNLICYIYIYLNYII